MSFFFFFVLPLFFIKVRLTKRKLTSDQPTTACEVGQVQRMNLSLCVRKLLVSSRSTVWAFSFLLLLEWGDWFRFDNGRIPGRRSNTIVSRCFRFGSRAKTRNRQCDYNKCKGGDRTIDFYNNNYRIFTN